MDLLWPGFLLLLGLIPLIVAIYIWMLRRRRRFAVRYSSLALVREAHPHQSRLRRHLPFAMFLLALASLVIALGRPVAIVNVPTGQTTVILAMDVSWSMCSTDIQPNRLQAAKAAALSFIERQKSSTQIGIVAFAGFAELIQASTTDQEMLQDAVEGLTTGRRTAIGSAILKSLDAIAEVDKSVAPSVTGTSSGGEPTPMPGGAYAPDIIVLLTDGASNAGPWPLDAAQQAADRGVRVYTIGFGTAEGGIMNCGQPFQGGLFSGGQQFGGDPQFGGSARFRRGIDEDTLKQIADMTGGTYYSAESADELQHVFQNLPTYLRTRQETTEISVAFTAIGALLAALAILLALIWHPLP
jgi:Ca-activated chloride channel family protein